jgi:superfamily II DNA helicase RecQ
MVEYCENVTVCRHRFIVEYFGESYATMSERKKKNLCVDGQRCDVCKDPKKVIYFFYISILMYFVAG